jgi:hypothetical protein
MPAIRKFYLNLIVFAFVLGILIYGVQHLQTSFYLNNWTYLVLVYLAILTAVNSWISFSGLKKDSRTFITRIYSSIGLRFVFGIGFLVIYLIINPQKDLPFILAFLILYFLFTVFEIYFLVATLRPNSKSKQTVDE